MRLRISLSPENGALSVPLHYNQAVQGFVYHNLDDTLARWLHDDGHAYERRRFKLFTFSRLFGRRERKGERQEFTGTCSFHLSSVDHEVLGSLAEHLLKKPNVRLGSARCRVEEVAVEPEPSVNGAPMKVRTLAPITAYSTLTTPAGKRRPTTTVHRNRSGASRSSRISVARPSPSTGPPTWIETSKEPGSDRRE